MEEVEEDRGKRTTTKPNERKKDLTCRWKRIAIFVGIGRTTYARITKG